MKEIILSSLLYYYDHCIETGLELQDAEKIEVKFLYLQHQNQ